jgi:hypothetical protein
MTLSVAVQAAFAAFTKLTAQDKAIFCVMQAGHAFKADAASTAGRKAAATKKTRTAAPPAPAS